MNSKLCNSKLTKYNKLILRSHMHRLEQAILNAFPSEVTISFNVFFFSFLKHRVVCNVWLLNHNRVAHAEFEAHEVS